MKRIVTFLLACVLVFQMTGCQSSKKEQEKTDNKGKVSTEEKAETKEEKEEETDKTEESAEETKTVEGTTSEGTEDATATTAGQTSSTSQSTSKPTVSTNTSTGTQEVVVDKIEVPDVPDIKQEIQTSSSHAALSAGSYYQYSCLSSTEKAVYTDLCNAMKNCEVTVDLSARKCSTDTASKAYYAVIADYPQFFYMAKGFAYSCDKANGIVKEFVLMYSDGQIADEIDGNGKLVPKADRNKISQQISAFNSAVSGILSQIPTSLNAEEKEKRIYDYIQDTVSYDNQTASSGNVVSHSYDAYGAACNKKAVCEGYAELFQYLCYCVGINATPVNGTANGGSHMWNAVLIDSEWYMVDATWDDLEDAAHDKLHGYSYFNITESEMGRDHVIDRKILKVPSCNKDSHEFYKTHAIYLSSLNSQPSNYREVIDHMVSNGDKYLYVYLGNIGAQNASTVLRQIAQSQEVQDYLRQKGVTLNYQDCGATNNYLFITRQ